MAGPVVSVVIGEVRIGQMPVEGSRHAKAKASESGDPRTVGQGAAPRNNMCGGSSYHPSALVFQRILNRPEQRRMGHTPKRSATPRRRSLCCCWQAGAAYLIGFVLHLTCCIGPIDRTANQYDRFGRSNRPKLRPKRAVGRMCERRSVVCLGQPGSRFVRTTRDTPARRGLFD